MLRICFERRTILADGPEARVDEKEEEGGREERKELGNSLCTRGTDFSYFLRLKNSQS